MSNVSRHHHYVPQFYLAGFNESGEKNGSLCVTDLVEEKCFVTSPKKVGAKRDFNRVDVPGVKMDALEKAFSRFETEVAPVLAQVIEDRELPKNEDMSILLNFVALLGMRNPQIRSNFAEAEREVLRKMAHLMVGDKERWEAVLEQFREENSEIDLPEVSYEEMKEFVEEERYEIEFKHGHHSALELDALDAVLPYLFERKWSLLIAREGEGKFICSDRPVVLNSKGEGKSPYGVGLGTPNTELTMPLSKCLALLATFEGPPRKVRVDRFVIGAVNSRVIGSCNRQVYAESEDFEYLAEDGFSGQSELLNNL